MSSLPEFIISTTTTITTDNNLLTDFSRMSSSAALPELVVEKVRVVAHTMGPVAAGAQLSQNHWSIYLTVIGGGYVQLNMETNTAPGERKGIFKVTRHLYELTTSNVRHWDFSAASNVTVEKILRLIGEKKRNRYRMTSTGVGCRHWVCVSRLSPELIVANSLRLTVINDLVQAGYICDNNATSTLAQVIQFNYSRNQQPILLPMLAGSFY